MQYTKEQKTQYFKSLRERWQATKSQLNNEQITAIEAIIKNHGLKISITGYAFVAAQMRSLGLDGFPYLDCKTFQGWRENGFLVIKGEKSQISGITWIGINEDEETGDFDYMLPKQYHLFHRSQVQGC